MDIFPQDIKQIIYDYDYAVNYENLGLINLDISLNFICSDCPLPIHLCKCMRSNFSLGYISPIFGYLSGDFYYTSVITITLPMPIVKPIKQTIGRIRWVGTHTWLPYNEGKILKDKILKLKK